MSLLLKILAGSQEGAEILLPPGKSLCLGSSLECDVVLVDALCASRQAQLAISEDGETVTVTALANGVAVGDKTLAENESAPLPAAVVMTLGGCRLAVGSAQEPWQQLQWPGMMDLAAARNQQSDNAPVATETAEEEKSAAVAPQPPTESDNAQEKKDSRKSSRRGGWVLLVVLLVLLGILLAIGTGAAFWVIGAPPPDLSQQQQEQTQQQLQSWIDRNGLTLQGNSLTGNMPSAAERRRLEIFVYTHFPEIRPELTDDETLLASLEQVLHGLEGEGIQIEKVAAGKAQVYGIANSAEAWQADLEAIRRDVPKLRAIDGQVVFVDESLGRLTRVLRLNPHFKNVAVSWEDRRFVFKGVVSEESRELFAATLKEMGKYLPKNVQLLNTVKYQRRTATAAAPQAPGVEAPSDDGSLPVRGILFQPYSCIVLEDGSRVFEGGSIGDYVVRKITVDEVRLQRPDGSEFSWRP